MKLSTDEGLYNYLRKKNTSLSGDHYRSFIMGMKHITVLAMNNKMLCDFLTLGHTKTLVGDWVIRDANLSFPWNNTTSFLIWELIDSILARSITVLWVTLCCPTFTTKQANWLVGVSAMSRRQDAARCRLTSSANDYRLHFPWLTHLPSLSGDREWYTYKECHCAMKYCLIF